MRLLLLEPLVGVLDFCELVLSLLGTLFHVGGRLDEVFDGFLDLLLETSHSVLGLLSVLLFCQLFVLNLVLLLFKFLGVGFLKYFVINLFNFAQLLLYFLILGLVVGVLAKTTRLVAGHGVGEGVEDVLIRLGYARLSDVSCQILLLLEQIGEGIIKRFKAIVFFWL